MNYNKMKIIELEENQDFFMVMEFYVDHKEIYQIFWKDIKECSLSRGIFSSSIHLKFQDGDNIKFKTFKNSAREIMKNYEIISNKLNKNFSLYEKNKKLFISKL